MGPGAGRARWRRRRASPSGTPGMALCCSLDWEMEPGGRDGKAASASCTFCIPAMAALGGLPFLGRRSLLYAGARRLSSVARWPGGPSESRGCFMGRGRRNWLPKPARPTTFLILVGARRRVAGVSRSRPEGLSPHGTRRDGCWCLLVPYMPLARLVELIGFAVLLAIDGACGAAEFQHRHLRICATILQRAIT